MVVDICRAMKRQGKYPPLFTNTKVNNNNCLVYTTQVE